MPAWSQKNGGPLSDEEIDALTAYILSWQTGSASNLPPMPTYTPYPPVSPVPNVQGDPNQGAVLFGENCAGCHGPNGEGRVGATLAKNWPSVRPDLTIEATIKNGVPGSVMPAWGQQKGGPLSDQNVNDLVAFILSRTPNQAAQVTETPTPLAPATVPWLRGWGGVVIFILLFVLILVGAFFAQRRT
jgi:mono/diheme cytochrome c family protein